MIGVWLSQRQMLELKQVLLLRVVLWALVVRPILCLGHFNPPICFQPTIFCIAVRVVDNTFARMIIQGATTMHPKGANGQLLWCQLWEPIKASIWPRNHAISTTYPWTVMLKKALCRSLAMMSYGCACSDEFANIWRFATSCGVEQPAATGDS